MDFNAYSSLERSLLVAELTQGLELVKHLRSQMGPEYSDQLKDMLIQQIVASYEKALFILGCGRVSGLNSEPPHQLLQVAPLAMPSTPLSGLASFRNEDRSVQDCWATKQVQRSDDDPNVLHIKYKGNHTCDMARQSKSAPTSPANQQPKSDNLPLTEHQQDSEILLSFQDSMGAAMLSMEGFPIFSETFGSFNGDSSNISPSNFNFTDSFYEPFSSSFISPTTSGSNCFSMSPCKMDTIASVQQNQQQNMEGNINEVVSVANSLTIDPDFSLDPWSFELNFQSTACDFPLQED